MASLFTPPYLDVGNGLAPSDGALLYFNIVGSETDKDTYTTAAATTAHANPVVSDSKGVFPAIYLSGDYDWVLQDKNNVQKNTGSVSELVTGSGQLSNVLNKETTLAAVLDTSLTVGLSLKTLGHTTAGDGGHGFYEVVAAGTGTNDGGAYIDSNPGGSFQLKLIETNPNVRQWGGFPDGVTDMSASAQAAIDSGVKSLFFPKPSDDAAYMCWDLDVGAGLKLYSNGATYKLPVIPNGFRGITTYPTGYTGDVDSDPLIIEGFVFDGNRVNQGAYLGFEKEQSALLFLSAAKSSGAMPAAGLLTVNISNCHFKESTADGISIHRGVNLTLADCTYYNCFRGSFTITGGGSRVTGTNQMAGGDVHPSAHQIEVDSSGFGGGRDSWVNVSNSQFAGGFDVATQLSSGEPTAEADWFYSNCSFGTQDGQPFNVNANSMARLRAVNCDFGVGTDASRIFRPGDTKFTGCNFNFNSTADVDDFVQPGTDDGFSTFSGQRLRFSSCNFNYDSSYAADAGVVISSASNTGNKLTIDTATVHGLATGDFVTLDNVGPTASYSGNFYVTAIPTTTQFQVVTAKSYGTATFVNATMQKRKPASCISFSADDAPDDNLTVIENCNFPKEANYAVKLKQGGKLIIKDNTVNSACGYFVSTSGTRAYDVSIGGNTHIEDMRMYMVLGASVNTGNRLMHQNTVLEEKKNVMWTVSNYTYAGAVGHRIIEGTTPSIIANDSSTGFQGDEWRIDVPVSGSPYSWVARTSNYTTQNSAWRILGNLA